MSRGSLWSAHAAELIQWFVQRQAEFPATPFSLNAWTYVRDPATFYAALIKDIARGPRSFRADALVGDLEDLFAWWAQQGGVVESEHSSPADP